MAVISGNAVAGKRPANEAALESVRGYAGLSRGAKDLVRFIVFGIVMIFLLVGLQAYSATLQHANNELQSENAYIQAEIDSLDSKIVEQTKISKIENTAVNKYGMVYPTSENCVTIQIEEAEMAGNLAAKIKKEAYN